jgi:hypothetical protein
VLDKEEKSFTAEGAREKSLFLPGSYFRPCFLLLYPGGLDPVYFESYFLSPSFHPISHFIVYFYFFYVGFILVGTGKKCGKGKRSFNVSVETWLFLK